MPCPAFFIFLGLKFYVMLRWVGLKPHGPGGGAKVLRHAPGEGMGNKL